MGMRFWLRDTSYVGKWLTCTWSSVDFFFLKLSPTQSPKVKTRYRVLANEQVMFTSNMDLANFVIIVYAGDQPRASFAYVCRAGQSISYGSGCFRGGTNP